MRIRIAQKRQALKRRIPRRIIRRLRSARQLRRLEPPCRLKCAEAGNHAVGGPIQMRGAATAAIFAHKRRNTIHSNF